MTLLELKEKLIVAGSPGSLPRTNHFRFLNPGHLLEKILCYWGADSVEHMGPCSAKGAYLPLERMVVLTGTLKGFVVVRSTREFACWLRNLREQTPMGRYREEEIFEELTALFCLYLFHDFWRPQLFEVGPLHPFPSIPQDWPVETPTASCSLKVGEHPLEVRLWLKD